MMHFQLLDQSRQAKKESHPVVIDIPRMKQALASKRYLMPEGLSREQMSQYILAAAREK